MPVQERSLHSVLFSLPIGWIVAVGVGLRLLWVLLCPNEPSSDQLIYDVSAKAIAEGRGYVGEDGEPAGYWPVGYSALLAPFYWLLGPAVSSAFIANVAMGALTILGSYELGKLWFEERSGKIVAWALAIHPTLVMYVTCVASENSFITGTIWCAYCMTLASRTSGWRSWGWVALCGILIGITGYVRATIVIFCGLIPVLFLMTKVSLPRTIVKTLVITAFAALTLLPWAIRNQTHFGTPQPFSYNGSANLWMGNHEGARGGYVPLPPDVDHLALVERERVLGQRAREFILGAPMEYAKLSLRRLFDTMKTDTISVSWNRHGIEARLGAGWMKPLKLLTTGVHWMIWGTALWGLGKSLLNSLSLRRWTLELGESLGLSSVVLLAVPFVLIVSGNRYHTPLIPFAVLLASNYAVRFKSA